MIGVMMLDKAKINDFMQQISVQQAKLAKDRDELCKILEELDALKEACTEAYDNLQAAVDALSQLV
jgi:5'-deoxynucleotidase YfbR-like HD superfamily hydrolase